MIWTEDKKKLLRALAAQGLSSREILAKMGDRTLTTNAIIGASHRYGAQLLGGRGRKKNKAVSKGPDIEKRQVEKIMSRIVGKPKAVIAPPGETKSLKIRTGKLSYSPFSGGLNTGTARCMWSGCKNMSIAKGKPYCSFHMEKYRKAS